MENIVIARIVKRKTGDKKEYNTQQNAYKTEEYLPELFSEVVVYQIRGQVNFKIDLLLYRAFIYGFYFHPYRCSLIFS